MLRTLLQVAAAAATTPRHAAAVGHGQPSEAHSFGSEGLSVREIDERGRRRRRLGRWG